jgi:hypothetical protein
MASDLYICVWSGFPALAFQIRVVNQDSVGEAKEGVTSAVRS